MISDQIALGFVHPLRVISASGPRTGLVGVGFGVRCFGPKLLWRPIDGQAYRRANPAKPCKLQGFVRHSKEIVKKAVQICPSRRSGPFVTRAWLVRAGFRARLRKPGRGTAGVPQDLTGASPVKAIDWPIFLN